MTTEPDPDVAREAIEYCYEQGWTDGLPVVPVSQTLLDEFLAQTSRGPDEVLWRMDHLGGCTVRTAAINAAMAGCLPEYFPVVLAAWDAVMRDRAAKGGGWQSTSGPAPLIVINGPIRGELGFNSTGGIFAAGFRSQRDDPARTRADAAQRVRRRPARVQPDDAGDPGPWAIYFGENEREESPWEPLAAEMGLEPNTSAVSCTLTRTYEFVDNRHTRNPEHLLWDFADTISRTGVMIFRAQSTGIVFCPEHAQMLANAGYSKTDVKDWLVEHCRPVARPTYAAPAKTRCPKAASAAARRATRSGSRATCSRRFSGPAVGPDRRRRRPERGDLDGVPRVRRVVELVGGNRTGGGAGGGRGGRLTCSASRG